MKIISSFLFIAWAVLSVAAPVFGELSDEELAALRERGRQEGWTFTVDRNPATKYSIEQLCGIIETAIYEPRGEPVEVLPESQMSGVYDWRSVVGEIPVRNQGSCGSCWAFAGTGEFEWAIRIRDGIVVDLAEQWLVSCNQDGWGCGGGNMNLGLDYYSGSADPCGHTGAVMETNFPYTASDLPCNCPYDHPYILKSWGWVGVNPATPTGQEIKTAILTRGPVGVGVAVDHAFGAYSGGIFNACNNTQALNHGVVLVGWDDTQGSNGVWILRNSWGPGWGEGGYMRIEYGCSSVGSYASYVEYDGPVPPELAFDYPQGIPDTIPPYETTSFDVDIRGVYNGVPAPGTGLVHYTINGGPVDTAPMTDVSPGRCQVSLPRVDCDDLLEFYLSMEETEGQRFYDPAPDSPLTVSIISEEVMLFADDFISDKGWTVTGDATEGQWERGIPLGRGDRGDPALDFDGSFLCYLTGNADGDSDVESGITYLDSPTFDLSSGNAQIFYARWFSNDFSGGTRDDLLEVYISNDGGIGWTLVETIGPEGEEASGGWVEYSFWAGDFVTPTDQMRLRFAASDTGEESVVEAALDAVRVAAYACYECDCPGYCDLNLDGRIDPVDVSYIVSYVYRQLDAREQIPHCIRDNGDWDCSGQITPLDVTYYVYYVYKQEGNTPEDPCAL